jgi:hypothetical protein
MENGIIFAFSKIVIYLSFHININHNVNGIEIGGSSLKIYLKFANINLCISESFFLKKKKKNC